jgi:multisubunit Na+/H+ antiporter MnhB subunit
MIGFIICLFVFEPLFTGGILIAVSFVVLYLGAQYAWSSNHNYESHLGWKITNAILFILIAAALFFSLSRA